MLPSAKTSLQKGGYSSEASSWILIALFFAGAAGIQVVSRIIHQYIPSHMVDCDHSHEDDEEAQKEPDHSHANHVQPKMEVTEPHSPRTWPPDYGTSSQSPREDLGHSAHDREETIQVPPRRPSFTTKVSQLVSPSKAYCDGDGQCYGYTDPCGINCFKFLPSQGRRAPHGKHSHPPLSRSATTPNSGSSRERQPLLPNVVEHAQLSVRTPSPSNGNITQQPNGRNHKKPSSRDRSSSPSSHHSSHHQSPAQHHHHVPTNAFLAIGLQTSIAIALHKLPEGFITYATNHANPKLGFTVFLALFIHNITEGFAMALPLYLAINSRGKAMFWSALLGGISQPCGAGVAAIWFKLAGNEGGGPSEAIYGGMFAIVCEYNSGLFLLLKFYRSRKLTVNLFFSPFSWNHGLGSPATLLRKPGFNA